MSNDNAERFVKQTLTQTGEAMDQYFNFVQNAFSYFPFSSPELTEKIKSFSAENIAAAEAFIQKLSQAKDFQDFIRIQTEYMQTQFHAFTEQTKSLTETFTKAATGSMKNY